MLVSAWALSARFGDDDAFARAAVWLEELHTAARPERRRLD